MRPGEVSRARHFGEAACGALKRPSDAYTFVEVLRSGIRHHDALYAMIIQRIDQVYEA
jgi:hypothetical protein